MTMRVFIKPYAKAATVYFGLYDATQPDVFLTGHTFATGDTKYSINGGSFSNTTNNPSEIGSTGVYSLDLTAAEMTATSEVLVKLADQTAPAAWMSDVLQIDITAWRTTTEMMQVWEVNLTSTPGTTGWDADLVWGTQTATSTLNDRMVIFVSGANDGAVCFVETYTNSGEDAGTFTVTELQTETAPGDGDRYIVV